ncbi:MAG: hypothetical protein RR014_03770 [Bilophila sp.]
MRYPKKSVSLWSFMLLFTFALCAAPVALCAKGEAAAPVAPVAAPTAAPTQQVQAPAEVAGAYSGNIKSKTFHKQGCRYFSCKSCSVHFASSAEATAKGYKPCKVCMK